MISSFLKLNEICTNGSINIYDKRMLYLIQDYLFIHISTQKDISNNEKIYENIKESNFVLIDQYKEENLNKNDKIYIIIGFKNTIIIIDKSSFANLQSIFSANKNLTFCFLSEIDDINFNKMDKINNQIKEEIKSFNQYLLIGSSSDKIILEIWKIIKSCISGYLIKESYEKNKINRMNKLFNDEEFNASPKLEIINENEFIELDNIGIGSNFNVKLIYHIKKRELFVLKKTYLNNEEKEKLTKRVIENHSKICHPFLPKFIGTNKRKDYVIMEFINGKTLADINISKLKYDDKITIIFELMMIIEFLHRNKFIYRDLKPSNIMLDANNTVILVDFDRMIEYGEISENFTNDFSSLYTAPEVNSGYFSYECDIYSIGLIAYYIMELKNPIGNINELVYTDNNDFIKTIIKICTYEYPENRPTILELILTFIEHYYAHIKIKNLFEQYIKQLNAYYNLDNSNDKEVDQDISEVQYILGVIYQQGKIVPCNIEKAIHYFTIAANQNHLNAQYNLGIIYSNGKQIQIDAGKSIHYLSLAADQNDSDAQYNLGIIYGRGELVKRDVNKAIHYLSLAANQNSPDAQFNLGVIYEKGELVKRDINKAIYYYSLSANQNYIYAQFNLGIIYEKGELVKRDINKAIYYYSLSANQNYIYSQYNLGLIYIKGELAPRDVGKSIHYFSLAAGQNYSDAQYNLGVIYEKGELVKRDINKAIYYYKLAANQNHLNAQINLAVLYYKGKYVRDINQAIYYYKLAANQNHSDAQFILGIIFYEGKYIVRDINKAIYYFSLAANQKHYYAHFCLGLIYHKGEFISRDIKKAIFHYEIAANKNIVEAQLNLGLIYEKGISTQIDIKKAIYYYTLAANLNNSDALYEMGIIYFNGYHVHHDIAKAINYFQRAADLKHKRSMYIIGILYLEGNIIPKNLEKASYYLEQSVNDNNINSYFAVGYLYHIGLAYNQDIQKAIKFYKEASSFNNLYAKNNLGLIYKHKIKNFMLAINYFMEVIDKKKGINGNYNLALYNLAHLYFYNDQNENNMKKSIQLLIKSSNENFYPSILLLCIISIYNFGVEYENIINELSKYEVISSNLAKSIHNILKLEQLEYITVFEDRFNQLRDIDFIYDHHMNILPLKNGNLNAYDDRKNELTTQNLNNIDSDFYEGFGYDLLD